MRHFFISLLLLMLACLASSCVSRIMYEDGEFEGSDVIENADDIMLLNSEINQDDAFHDYSLAGIGMHNNWRQSLSAVASVGD